MEGFQRNFVRGASHELVLAAQQLRENLTPAERILWEALREKKLGGLRFRVQHPVGQTILDFYCPVCRLAVELDGGVHNAQVEKDAARTLHLKAHGYQVIRFRNEDVFNRLPDVLVAILEAAQSCLSNFKKQNGPPKFGEHD